MRISTSAPDKNISRRKFLKQSLKYTAVSALSVSGLRSLYAQSSITNATTIIDGFKLPYGIALGQGRLYVSDAADYSVKIFDDRGHFIKKFGQAGSQPGSFNYPQGLFVDSDLLYVMDANNGRLVICDADGNFQTSIGTIGGYPNAFYTPKGLFVSDKIYVCNTRNHFISVFDKNTHQLLAKFGELGDDPADLLPGSVEFKFRLPTGIALSADGKIYVVDSKHGQVKVLDQQGQFLFKFGGIGSEPGQFNLPEGIALDSQQNVYVCDALNGRIQQFSPDGRLKSIQKAGLKKPTTLQIDAANKFYIVDSELKQVIISDWKA